jgi:hypothetical protein
VLGEGFVFDHPDAQPEKRLRTGHLFDNAALNIHQMPFRKKE